MKRAVSTDAFLGLLRNSKLLDSRRLDDYLVRYPALPQHPQEAAERLVSDGLITPFQADQLLAGRYKGFFLLGGQYKVLKPIGRGGMGAVFLCEQVQLNRRVAVKVLPREATFEQVVLERFQREARAAAALDHPNIVRVHDVSASPGEALLVMEYAEGRNLQEILDADGPIPFRKAVGYVLQAAAGLGHAHERGVVHRDVKPSNLMLDRCGAVKVLDMGLARFLDKEDRLTQKFDDGAVLGTADYMSPEQAVSGGRIDARTDIYSLGVTLYALLNGRPPFSGSTTEKLFAHQVRDAILLHRIRPEAPAALSAVVARMMAKQPEQRYATAADVIAALAPFAEGAPAPTTEVRAAPPAGPSLWRRPLVVAGLATPVIVLLLVLAWGRLFARQPAGASAGPVAAAPAAGDAPQTPFVETELYRLNLDRQQPFVFRIEHAEYYSDSPFPDSWAGHCWKDGSVAEVLAEQVGDSMALGYRNLSGGPTCQLLTSLSGAMGSLQAGRRYILRVEYQADKQASAAAYVRRADATSIASIPLRPTDGRWAVAETTIEQEAEAARDLAFCTTANGADSTVFIRSVVLAEQVRP